MGWDDDMIKANEYVDIIINPKLTSQQVKDKDAYNDGIIEESNGRLTFPKRGTQPIKVEKNAPTEVGESELFIYLKKTYSTDELKALASLPRDKAVEIVEQAKKLHSK